MVIFRCDGTYEGILTAVFSGYRSDDVMIECDNDNMFVFGECTEVVTDLSKSLRVAKGIRKISYEAEYMMYLAALNNNPDRGTDIFYFVKSVFQNGAGGISDYHDVHVANVNKMCRNTGREYDHFRGFSRFEQYDNFLLGKIHPVNNLLTLLGSFFTDRLLQENFVIADMGRGKAAVHNKGGEYIITDVDTGYIMSLQPDDKEKELKRLYEMFRKSISIKERTNINLQKQNMPLRFREYM